LQLHVVAPIVAELKTPIIIANVNIDKYIYLARKYKV